SSLHRDLHSFPTRRSSDLRDAQHPEFRAVRVLFQKNGDEWQPFRSACRNAACLKATAAQYPREVVWTIAFDGKNLGQVTSRGPRSEEHTSELQSRENLVCR